MIRQRKKYSRPQRPFDKGRIEDENILREKYGLKNKKEIWKADASIGRVRNLAKELITASDEDKQAFIERLQARGFKVEKIADVLSLDKEDWLKRRLQTIMLDKKLTTTPKQARQLIAHKHVSIGDQTVNVPSYMVTLAEESMVTLNIVLKVAKPKSKEEQIKEEIANDGESGTSSEDHKNDDEIMAEETKVEEVKNEVVEENTDNSNEGTKEEFSDGEEEPAEDKTDGEAKEEEKAEDTKTEDKSKEKTE
jgi:small subunit ribosomal protein S4